MIVNIFSKYSPSVARIPTKKAVNTISEHHFGGIFYGTRKTEGQYGQRTKYEYAKLCRTIGRTGRRTDLRPTHGRVTHAVPLLRMAEMPAKACVVHGVFHSKAARSRPGHRQRYERTIGPQSQEGAKFRYHGTQRQLYHSVLRLCVGGFGTRHRWLPREGVRVHQTQDVLKLRPNYERHGALPHPPLKVLFREKAP